MAQRVYWVIHTRCSLECRHCHNDSGPGGHPGSPETVDAVLANLPDPTSPYRLEDVLIGGGEPLLDEALLERAIVGLRRRFPNGPAGMGLDDLRREGHLVVAIQTNGLLLADSQGHLDREKVERWLRLGIDYYQVASGDVFHQSRRPGYPWAQLYGEMKRAGDEATAGRGVRFLVYGKPSGKLVPSGRVLTRAGALADLGAEILTGAGYCAQGWETASNWMHPEQAYPACSEVVIDEFGLVHPCCWYRLSPPLFDLTRTSFEAGMTLAADSEALRLLDRGEIVAVGLLAGLTRPEAESVRDALGDCGACRVFFLRLANLQKLTMVGRPQGNSEIAPLSPSERAHYTVALRGMAVPATLTDLLRGADSAAIRRADVPAP